MYTNEEIKEQLPELDCHEAAIRLPKMQGDKLEGLKFDLLDNGMRNPIWIVNGQILDGKSRYEILRWLKVNGQLHFEPDIREWPKTDDNFSKILRSLNIHRNDYDKNQLAAYAARYLVPGLKEEALLRMHKKIPMELFPEVKKGTTNQIAALIVGTNEKYIQDACKIKNKHDKFLDFVMNKQMSLKEGKEFISLESIERDFLFERMKVGMAFKDAKAFYKKTLQLDSSQDAHNAETKQNAKMELSQAEGPIMGIVFPKAIHQNILDEIKQVLNKHGYSDLQFKVLMTTSADEVQAMVNSISPVSTT